jgi:parallel beta-helix repeat protein
MRDNTGFLRVCVCACLLSVGSWQASPAKATTWNVTQFGAVPNGSTDDTSYINATIAAAQPGDTVYFPAGVYDISNSINAKAGVALLGAAVDSTSIKYIAGAGANGTMINLGSQSNVQVSNLTLNGNNDSYLSTGISAGGSPVAPVSNEYIHNIAVTNYANANYPGAGVWLWGVSGSTVSNNQMSNGNTGTGLTGCSGCLQANNVVANCMFGVNDNSGMNDTVINNTISIINQPSEGLAAMGVGGTNLLVQGNVMNHWITSGLLLNCAIRNNVITATDGSGTWAGIEMAGGANSDIFSGNVIIGGQIGGFTETNNGFRQQLYYANNVVRGMAGGTNGGSGLIVGAGNQDGDSKQEYFYANTFAANTAAGISIGGCQMFDFDSNVFSGNVGVGIAAGGTSPTTDMLRFVNNTITNNGGGAISSLQLSNLYFDSSNTVSGNGGSGNSTPTTTGTFYNNMPTVSIVGTATASVGSLVTFSSLFNDPGGYSAANYLWDLGGGLPVTTSTASFTYSQTGTYDVGLVVWDSLGRAAHEQLVLTVTAAGADAQSVDGGALGTSADPASVPEPSAAILTLVAGLTAAACTARRRGQFSAGLLKQRPHR